MNPNYMAPQMGVGYGGYPPRGPPPPGQHGQPAQHYNHEPPPPNSQGFPPNAPPGDGAGPQKPGPPVHNGPQMMPPAPPQGDQYPSQRGMQPPPPGGQAPPMKPGAPGQWGPQTGPNMGPPGPQTRPNMGPPGPQTGQNMGAPGPQQQQHVNQLSNDMGGMNLSGFQQQRPGAPPPGGMMRPGAPGPPPGPGQSSPANMGYAPPASQGYAPPASQGMTMSPPRQPAGPPPPGSQQRGPPTGMPPPPASQQMSGPPPGPQQYGMPPSSAGMAPPPSMGMPPPPQSSMAPPTSSLGAPPPSMGMAPPPSSMGMAPPPSSMGMAPPPSSMGMAPPPLSMAPTQTYNMGAPPGPMSGNQSSMQMNMPPSQQGMGGPPMMVPGGQQAPPPPMDGTGLQGGPQMGPPPSPGGQYGNYGAPQPGFPAGQRPPGPGVPGVPGPGVPGPGSMGAQPHTPRRLDPDQMPSAIQVIEDDKRNNSGVFQTGNKGKVPPLVTTDFYAEDQGNCSPRFIRSTMYNIPCTSDMLKQCHLPLALNITPFPRLHPMERPPPFVDLGQLGPVRCNRCKAYMCPNMQFIDGGRRFQCCFCSCTTEVPPEYFAHLDHTGRRVDCYDRPELYLGAYEIAATSDYCKNNKLPKAPAFIFMIDISYSSMKSGLVNLLCSRLKEEVLVNLPMEANAPASEIRVGFVTYGKELHFYNVKGTLAQPQMLVVSDVQDVFVPLLDGFLVTLSEAEGVIDSLMSQIPEMFADSRETEVVLGPVIQAGLDALNSAERPGKLYIFHSSLPVADAPGKLRNRDDRKLLGTEKEKTLLTPQTNFYTKLGQDCVAAGCSVDLFLFPNTYVDVASMAEVPRVTGGSVHKYPYFQADLDGTRFMDDLRTNVMKPIGFDGIMRVRTSTGIRPTDFFGNFYMSNTTDVELSSVDCDKSIVVEIKHDDKLSESDGAFVQAAVLYTTITGQRRLRVLNLAFNCCTQMADLFRNCELDALINYMSKVAIQQTLNSNPKQVRDTLTTQCSHILACYRKNCASPSSAGQLILPECMKLLPVYTNCILKSNILQGGTEVSTDERSFLTHMVNAMPVDKSSVFFYPRLLPIHDLDIEATDIPTAIRCSYERLKDDGAYLIENGLVLYMWIGHNIRPEWVQCAFGVQSIAQIDIDKTVLQCLDNPLSRRLVNLVRQIREQRYCNMKLVIVRQRDKLEPVFQQYLAEDRGANGTASYVDFLCHIHKEIRTLLS